MSVFQKNNGNLDVLAPNFYRTFVCTKAYYDAHSADIPNGTLIYITDDTSTNSALLESVYPVGSVYVTLDDNFDPATGFGFGTWSRISAGLVLSSGDGTDAGTTGGSNTLTLTNADVPNHVHSVTAVGTVTSTFSGTASTHRHSVLQNSSNESYTTVYARGAGSSLNKGGVALPNTSGTQTSSETNAAGNYLLGNASVTPSGSVTSTFSGTAVNSANNTGGSSNVTKNIQNAYIKVSMWKRTA